MTIKKKIGVFLINKSYTIYHAISIAIELANDSDYQVHIFCIEKNHALILRILKQFSCKNIVVKVLRPHWYFNMPYYLEVISLIRLSIFHKYQSLFKSFDVFVSPMSRVYILKGILKKEQHIKYIFSEHGIPNSSYALSSYVTGFDLFFLSGEKQRQLREKLGHLTPTNHAVTGYFKYEVVKDSPLPRLFSNDNPTILYNPHWRNDFNSMPKFGKTILDFFATNPDYNLIFAPHVRLLSRRWWLWSKILKYKKYPNILIDADSEFSHDMTYTKYANIYLGDASSQAFEFILAKERPCIFLDAHDLNNDKKNRPLSWDLGDVISEACDFEKTLKESKKIHTSHYYQKQLEIKKEMFHHDEHYTPSQLAVHAIKKLLDD